MNSLTKLTQAPSLFALLAGLLALTVLAYLPGLYGDFIFDDFINIVSNTNAQLEQLTFAEIKKVFDSGVATALSRPLSMLTFGFNYYATGMDPFYFKLTNLLIHLLTSLCIYFLTFELLKMGSNVAPDAAGKIRLLSLFITACWALHPLNVSTVLYVVQRMTQLSALTTLFTLLYYCRFRQRPSCSRREGLVAFAVVGALTLTGILFKENAALVVLFILCIEFFLLRFQAATDGHKLFLKLFVVFMLILPASGALVLLFVDPEQILAGYEARTFTVWERLLTEARVLWLYIGWLLMPDNRQMVFYYDNFPLSHSLLDPASTAIAIAGLAGLLYLCFRARRRVPLLCFGIAFFFAGHAMESTVVGLELVFEHRNYLPGYGLMLGIIYAFLHYVPEFILRKQAAAAFMGLYLLFLAHGTYAKAQTWSNSYNHLLAMIEQNPDSHRTNYGMGYFLLNYANSAVNREEVMDVAADYFKRAAELDPDAIRGHVGVVQAESQNGKPIDQAVLDDLNLRIRTTPRLQNYIPEIGNMTECWYSGSCRFDSGVMIGVFNAMASNTATPPPVVQGLLDQLGTTVAYIFNRKEDGKALLYLARDIRPDFTIIDLKLIRLEIEAGNYDQAGLLIDAAKTKPGSEDSEELDQLETLLNEAATE